MKLERKTYATRNQKVGDFVIGIALWHVTLLIFWLLNVGLGIGVSVLLASNPDLIALASTATMLLSCLPFVAQIGLVIYFGLTRYWIALGMLATFALYFVLTLCAMIIFGAACFAILGGLSGSPGF